MAGPNFVLLYVDSPEKSAAFYAGLLDQPPIAQSPTFALFKLPSGTMLGLWSRHTVEPGPAGAPGSAELAFTMPSEAAVRATYDAWKDKGLTIIQPPQAMDFGFTFTGTDPDGHRLRVLVPGEP